MAGADAERAPQLADAAEQAGSGPGGRQIATLAVLAAVAAVLAAIVVLTVLPTLNPPAPTAAGTPLVEVDPAQVTGIDAVRGDATVRFNRTPGGWARSSPQGVEDIDPDRLDGFLSTLASLKRLSELSGDDLVPADFGLEPPRGEIVLHGPSDVRIVIGDRNPPLTALYVQVLPDPRIVLVGSVLLWEFDKLTGLAAGVR
jgi:hypothetical protein